MSLAREIEEAAKPKGEIYDAVAQDMAQRAFDVANNIYWRRIKAALEAAAQMDRLLQQIGEHGQSSVVACDVTDACAKFRAANGSEKP